MDFSLILCTVGRTTELNTFLLHLAAQNYRSFELIVVDQNQDDKLRTILDPYASKFPIKHIHSKKGLSKARNRGLKYAEGRILAFPDDDCWYPFDLLNKIRQIFIEKPEIDGITGRAVDKKGVNIARFANKPGFVTKLNAWQRSASYSIFLKNSVIQKVGEFDETLGLGSGTIWGGGEDIDYPIRAACHGFRIYFSPDIYIHHPRPEEKGYADIIDRSFNYGAGIGRVWRKHHYPFILVAYYLLRPIGGVMLSLVNGDISKARYHWNGFLGRWVGWQSK